MAFGTVYTLLQPFFQCEKFYYFLFRMHFCYWMLQMKYCLALYWVCLFSFYFFLWRNRQMSERKGCTKNEWEKKRRKRNCIFMYIRMSYVSSRSTGITISKSHILPSSGSPVGIQQENWFHFCIVPVVMPPTVFLAVHHLFISLSLSAFSFSSTRPIPDFQPRCGLTVWIMKKTIIST